MKPKIMLGTPMYGGMCTGFFMQSVCGFIKACNDLGWGVANCFVFNESLIQRARNAITHEFLKSDCTHLLFIDADIRFRPGDIVAMVEADVDILCGIYPKKEINWHMVERAVKLGVPVEQLKLHTASFVLNLLDDQKEITIPQNQPFEILAGGTGCMLIKREVFATLAPRMPTYTNDVNDLGGSIKNDKIVEYFGLSIDPASNRLLSEDYHFCFAYIAAGGKVHAAPWVKLAHVGTYIFEGGMVEEQPNA